MGCRWPGAAADRQQPDIAGQGHRRLSRRGKVKVYRTLDQARADVFDCIERFYNQQRRHSTNGMSALSSSNRGPYQLKDGAHGTGSSSKRAFGQFIGNNLTVPDRPLNRQDAYSTLAGKAPNEVYEMVTTMGRTAA